MNLDEQLRAALNLEAEMVQTPIPDTQAVIHGGRDRRRRRNLRWTGGGVAAAIVLAAGLYGATRLGGDTDSAPDVTGTPTQTPTQGAAGEAQPWPSSLPDRTPVEPGTYRLNAGLSGDGALIAADLTLGTGWEASSLPIFQDDAGQYGGAGAQLVEQLPGAADYCSTTVGEPGWDAAGRTAATSSRALAQQLAQLPSSTLVEPVTPTRAFGHDAFHLRLRIDDNCGDQGAYVVFRSGDQGLVISYNRGGERQVVVDVLVVDVDGTPAVTYYWYPRGADPRLAASVTSARDSISFVPST